MNVPFLWSTPSPPCQETCLLPKPNSQPIAPSYSPFPTCLAIPLQQDNADHQLQARSTYGPSCSSPQMQAPKSAGDEASPCVRYWDKLPDINAFILPALLSPFY